jgi:ribokinase
MGSIPELPNSTAELTGAGATTGPAPAPALGAGRNRRGVVVVTGSLNLDLVGRAPHIPAPGETVLGDSLQRFHGGKGGNQAVAAARLGAAVRLFGAVGDDAAGAELMEGLAAEHIDSHGVRRVAGASGCALITVSARGENAITVLPGANRQVVGPQASALLGAALLVLQLEIPLAVNRSWARTARSLGLPVLLNAAPLVPAARELLADVSVLVVNEDELSALVTTYGQEGSSGTLEEKLQLASQLGPPDVVVTLGAQGCVLFSQGEPNRVVRVPGMPVEVLDTTGAGDTFVGALAGALAAGQSLPEALPWANAAAAMSCTQAGARAGMPNRAVVQALLAGQ